MSDFVSKEVCEITHKQLNKSIDKLCSNIDRAVEVSIQTSKEVYLICGKIKDIDKLNDKMDNLKIETTKNTTMWKLFGIIATVMLIGGGVVFGIMQVI